MLAGHGKEEQVEEIENRDRISLQGVSVISRIGLYIHWSRVECYQPKQSYDTLATTDVCQLAVVIRVT